MPIPTVAPEAVAAAKAQLDGHLREIIQWHFSPETGCPFWLDWAKKNWDPRQEVQSFEDVLKFSHFQDETLRDLQPEVWVPYDHPLCPPQRMSWLRSIPTVACAWPTW
jgi:hypothetical protein